MIRLERICVAGIIATALVVGCSASSGGYYSDAGPDGGINPKVDAGGTTDDADAGLKKDARKDTSTPPDEDADTPVEDADVPDTEPPTGCAPGDVSSFSPSWKPPVATHTGTCTAAQAQQAALCVYDSTQSATLCKSFNADAANQACLKCVFTPSTDPQWGPVIVFAGGLVQLNFAGCVARLSGNVTANGCGAKMQAANECSSAACDANCPVDSMGNGLAELNQCFQDAQAGDCASFATAATCGDTLIAAGGSAEACNTGTTTEDVAVNLAQIFCGP